MRARKLVVVCLCGAVMLTLCGCGPLPWSRTGNQGGSTITTLAPKVIGIAQNTTSFQALNPDDFQLMTDLVGQYTGGNIPAVSDDLAQATVDLIAANGVDDFDDLAELARQLADDPDSLVIPDTVTDEVLAEFANLALELSGINPDDIVGALQ